MQRSSAQLPALTLSERNDNRIAAVSVVMRVEAVLELAAFAQLLSVNTRP